MLICICSGWKSKDGLNLSNRWRTHSFSSRCITGVNEKHENTSAASTRAQVLFLCGFYISQCIQFSLPTSSISIMFSFWFILLVCVFFCIFAFIKYSGGGEQSAVLRSACDSHQNGVCCLAFVLRRHTYLYVASSLQMSSPRARACLHTVFMMSFCFKIFCHLWSLMYRYCKK